MLKHLGDLPLRDHTGPPKWISRLETGLGDQACFFAQPLHFSPLYVGAWAGPGLTQRRQSRLKDHVVNLISLSWWSVAKNVTALIPE